LAGETHSIIKSLNCPHWSKKGKAWRGCKKVRGAGKGLSTAATNQGGKEREEKKKKKKAPKGKKQHRKRRLPLEGRGCQNHLQKKKSIHYPKVILTSSIVLHALGKCLSLLGGVSPPTKKGGVDENVPQKAHSR